MVLDYKHIIQTFTTHHLDNIIVCAALLKCHDLVFPTLGQSHIHSLNTNVDVPLKKATRPRLDVVVAVSISVKTRGVVIKNFWQKTNI